MRIAVTSLFLAAFAHSVPALAQTEPTSEPKPRRSTFFVSTEVLYLETEPDTGGQVTLSFDDVDTVGVDLSLLGGHGLENFAYAPRATLGWRWNHTCGGSVGIQSRFFQLQDSVSGPATRAPGTVELPNFATDSETSDVELYSADVEAIVAYTRWGVTLEATYGNRWADLDTVAEIEVFGVFTTGNFVQMQLSNGSGFEGDGGVLGLSLAYKIPVPKVPLTVSIGKREADLDGSSSSFGRAVGTVADAPSPPLIGAATVTRNNADTSSLETEETRYAVQADFGSPDARVRSFVSLAYETMEWTIDGPPTGGAGFGGTIEGLTVNSFSSADLGGIEMEGWSLAIGIVF